MEAAVVPLASTPSMSPVSPASAGPTPVKKVSLTSVWVILGIILGVLVIAIVVFIAIALSKVSSNAKTPTLASANMEVFVPSGRVPSLPKPMTRTIVSEHPLLDVIHNFLSASEADHIVNVATSLGFKDSVVVKPGSGELVTDPTRTSKSVVLPYRHDPIIAGVEARAAKVAGVPDRNLEALQVVKYEPGQFYKAHHDYLPEDTPTVKTQGQRTVTMFVYLNSLPDGESGGGTKFPHLHHTIKPIKGAAALWHNVTPNGLTDVRTLHSGEPLSSGVKYGLNVWFRDRPQR